MTERDQLAADHALGLLEGEALLEARGLMANDPQFARAVAEWQMRLAPLLDEIVPVAPDPALWPQIEFVQAQGPRAEVVRLNRSVRRWQAGAGLAVAISAAASVALAFVSIRPQAPPVSPSPSVALASANQQTPAAKTLAAALALGPQSGVIMLIYLPAEHRMLSMARGFHRKAGHDYQLWLIPADGKPAPLGLLAGDGIQAMELAPELVRALDTRATLAVSLEPEGGSPTGLPTGPVLSSGKITAT